MKNLLDQVAKMGRNGDDMLIHISKQELIDLTKMANKPFTINPKTGLPEASLWRDAIAFAAPVIGGVIGGPLGSAAGIGGTAGAALGSGAGSLLTGGGAKGALMSAGLSLMGSAFNGAPTGGVEEGAGWSTGTISDTGDVFSDGAPGASIQEGIYENATSMNTLGGLALSGLMNVGSNAKALKSPALAPAAPMRDDNPYQVDPAEQRKYNPYSGDYSKYGSRPQEYSFFENNRLPRVSRMAEGGEPKYLQGDTDGQADKIPALLSDGEFVIPADVVAALGQGNNDAGANKLYSMMNVIRKAAYGHEKQMKKVPNNILEAFVKGRAKHFEEGGSSDDESGSGGSAGAGGSGGSSATGNSAEDSQNSNDAQDAYDANGPSMGLDDPSNEELGIDVGELGIGYGEGISQGLADQTNEELGIDVGALGLSMEPAYSVRNPRELSMFEKVLAGLIDAGVGTLVGPGGLALTAAGHLAGQHLGTGKVSIGKAMMGAYGPGEDPEDEETQGGDHLQTALETEARGNPYINPQTHYSNPLGQNLYMSPLRMASGGRTR